MRKQAEKPIHDVLLGLESGHVLRTLADAVREVTRASQETGKPGKVALQLTITPTSPETVGIAGIVKPTLPIADPMQSVEWADKDGRVLNEAPAPTDQTTIFDITKSVEE